MNNYQTLNLIATEIHEWGAKNFPVRLPAIGILEEIGEISHCVLKRYQLIRGFDNLEHFRNELLDAIADAGVYLLHSMAMKEIVLVNEIIAFPMTSKMSEDNHPNPVLVQSMLAELCRPAARILDGYKSMMNGSDAHIEQLQKLMDFSITYRIDFTTAVAMTWDKVKQRDWVKNPRNANVLINEKSTCAHGVALHEACPTCEAERVMSIT